MESEKTVAQLIVLDEAGFPLSDEERARLQEHDWWCFHLFGKTRHDAGHTLLLPPTTDTVQ